MSLDCIRRERVQAKRIFDGTLTCDPDERRTGKDQREFRGIDAFGTTELIFGGSFINCLLDRRKKSLQRGSSRRLRGAKWPGVDHLAKQQSSCKRTFDYEPPQ